MFLSDFVDFFIKTGWKRKKEGSCLLTLQHLACSGQTGIQQQGGQSLETEWVCKPCALLLNRSTCVLISSFHLFSKERGMVDIAFPFVQGSVSPVLLSCFQLEKGDPVPCLRMLTHIQGLCHSFQVSFTLVWLLKEKKKRCLLSAWWLCGGLLHPK